MNVMMLLPSMRVPTGRLEAFYRFGVSKRSDADNLVKSFQDILCEKYGFDDHLIYRYTIEKVDVKRGEEFIEFEIIAL